MALIEDLNQFLNDFGVSCTAGAVSALGILDMPGRVIGADGMVLTTDYVLTAKASDFGGLLYGDAMTVNGTNYSVREVLRIDDGAFVEVSLTKLAPDVPAPGSDPADFSLTLADLGDVELTSPTEGEVLKYDGSKWIDAKDAGTAYVYTQSAAASTWTINHNLGYVPSVEVFDSGSQEVDADVSHPNLNQTIIVFSVPLSGFARLI
jgi:hypothetical protein